MELDSEYSLFKSLVATNKIEVALEGYKDFYVSWKYYDYSPKEEKKPNKISKNDNNDDDDDDGDYEGYVIDDTDDNDDDDNNTKPAPLVIISSISIDLFFRQITSLCPKGYRIIAAEISGTVVDSYKIWTKSLHDFLITQLHIPTAHILGFQHGGLLAQLYASRFPQCVESLILINPFCSNKYFAGRLTSLEKMTFSISPLFLLRSDVLKGIPNENLPFQVAESFDFVTSCVEKMSRDELVTYLALLYSVPASAEPVDSLKDRVMLILSAEDEPYRSYPGTVLEDVRKFYPNAQVAELKRGCGEFPQLTVADEINMYIQIHLRKFQK